MFPYGMGWPNQFLTGPRDQQFPANVDWASLAKQWMELNQNSNASTNFSTPNDALLPCNMYDPSIPPPSYFPLPPAVPPPPPPPPPLQIPAPVSFPPYVSNEISIGNVDQVNDNFTNKIQFSHPVQSIPHPQNVQPFSLPQTAYISSQSNVDNQISTPCIPPLISTHPLSPVASPLLPNPPNSGHYFSPAQWSQQNQVPDSEVVADLKKKRLPAWIRDGLEKIEQERSRKIVEQLQQEQTWESNICKPPERNKFYDDNFSDDNLESDDSGPLKPQYSVDLEGDHVEWMEKDMNVSKCTLSDLSNEEIEELKMTVLRKVMTELLLSITNTEMRLLFESEQSRILRSKDAQPKIVATSAALSSLANEASSPESMSGTNSSRSSPLVTIKAKRLKEDYLTDHHISVDKDQTRTICDTSRHDISIDLDKGQIPINIVDYKKRSLLKEDSKHKDSSDRVKKKHSCTPETSRHSLNRNSVRTISDDTKFRKDNECGKKYLIDEKEQQKNRRKRRH